MKEKRQIRENEDVDEEKKKEETTMFDVQVATLKEKELK